jgi:hypothetical protein
MALGVAFGQELRVPMLHFLGWVGIAVVVVVIAVNAAFMLISPRAWFRLPEWFPGRGSMTEHKYGSGWGAVETRIAGGQEQEFERLGSGRTHKVDVRLVAAK